jgi:hypothetical protein
MGDPKVLDDNVGWETNERERLFSQRRQEWKLKNMKFLNLREGRKLMGKQPQSGSVWQFWRKRNEEERTSSRSVMS